jgi:hypothetical protein
MTNAQITKNLKFWDHKIRSTKAAPRTEARSSKQIQNGEKQNNYNAPNGTDRIHCFGFSDFEFILAPVCFGPRGFFRASNFGFTPVELIHLANQMAAIKNLLQAGEVVSHA